MRRDELTTLGIQLPVLPTIVIGALPGGAGWAPRLERIGLDVVSTGAARDTPETVAAAVAAVPHRPLKAIGEVPGARLVESGEPVAGGGVYRLDPDELVVVDVAAMDASMVAQAVLDATGEDPSGWWVAAAGLDALAPDAAAEALDALVEGVRQARLFLAKQQFD